MTGEPEPRSLQIDVRELVQRTVASLYSSLVTRPTGRAVRLAIETQLAEVGETALGLIDFSEVTLLDFSCADEVVAKLLMRYQEADRPREAFFVFRGVAEPHRDPIEAVLERQSLATVVQSRDGRARLLGSWSDEEGELWRMVEDRGLLTGEEVADALRPGERETVGRLVRRRLVFRSTGGSVYALSRMITDLS